MSADTVTFKFTYYMVQNPWSKEVQPVALQDWREGWTNKGKLVGDRLPVLRIENPKNPREFGVGRPFYMLRPDGTYVKDELGTRKYVVLSIHHDLTKAINYLGVQCILEPVHGRPLMLNEGEVFHEEKKEYKSSAQKTEACASTNLSQPILNNVPEDDKKTNRKVPLNDAINSSSTTTRYSEDRIEMALDKARSTLKSKEPSKHAKKMANKKISQLLRVSRHHKVK